MMCTLSVVIPAYNVSDYILASVRSVLEQRFRDLEVIVADDGSTDDTSDRVRSITDPRVRLIRQPNKGLSGARNRGIQEARGRFVGLLDGDDVWFPDKAQTHVDALNADPAAGLVFSHQAYLDAAGDPTGQLLLCGRDDPPLRKLLVRNSVGPPSVIVRRECFEQAGYFDEELRANEDWEWFVRLRYLTEFRFVLVPLPLCGYRIRPGSLTTQFEHHLTHARLAIEKMAAMMPSFDPALQKRALAEVYRILSRTALSSGNLPEARRLAWGALRQYPLLPLTDFRGLGTIGLVGAESMLPRRMQGMLYRTARRLMRAYYQAAWLTRA